MAPTGSFLPRIISIDKQQEKLFYWLAHQACAHTYLANYCLKKHSPERPSDQRSPLARHENTVAPGIRATDFSGPVHTHTHTESRTHIKWLRGKLA